MNRQLLQEAMKREMDRFLARTPKSAKLFEDAKKVMPGGVPMSWMSKWPGAYPTFVASANGSRITDERRYWEWARSSFRYVPLKEVL